MCVLICFFTVRNVIFFFLDFSFYFRLNIINCPVPLTLIWFVVLPSLIFLLIFHHFSFLHLLFTLSSRYSSFILQFYCFILPLFCFLTFCSSQPFSFLFFILFWLIFSASYYFTNFFHSLVRHSRISCTRNNIIKRLW